MTKSICLFFFSPVPALYHSQRNFVPLPTRSFRPTPINTRYLPQEAMTFPQKLKSSHSLQHSYWIALILAAACILAYGADKCKCTTGYRYFEGSCYLLTEDSHAFSRKCSVCSHKQDGYHNMASVKSQATLEFLTNWMGERNGK